MSKGKILLIGAGAPLLLALVTFILLKFDIFTGESNKVLAHVVFVGGVFSGVIILVFSLVNWLLDTLSLILGVDRD